jgi:GH24 family phage-related lysozyme (muramidase)
MKVSKECIDFVKRFEGFSATVYKDIVGVSTLGYGMTGSEIKGLTRVTEVQASTMLENLINSKYALPISNNLDSKKIVLKQNEFDALISMAYNIGIGGLLDSTLYKNICKGIRDKVTITSNFLMWNKAGGNVVAGLTRRRTEEAEMFLKDIRPAYQERYVRLFQEFYNEATKTSPQLTVDGEYGNLSQEAYKTLGRLLGGVY